MLLALLAVLPASSAQTVGDNLLADQGFEDTNMKAVVVDEGDGTTFAVTTAWNGWYTTSPRTQEWQNRVPNGTGRNNAGAGFVRSGNRSMELSRGFATFTAAVFQTVDVPAGSQVRGSAWYVMDLSEGASSQARVGIDPNGGTNPYDSDIAWSSWGGNQIGSFRQLTATTTATGNRVTLFLFATQSVPTQQNGIFWDDAELVITQLGSGAPQPQQPEPQPQQPSDGGPQQIPLPGSNPEPESPLQPLPTRTPVVIQTVDPNPDGSIIHQVNSGETLSSIVLAYNRNLNDILALNPELGDGSQIFPGDLVVIVPPPGSTPPPRATTSSPVTFTPAPVTRAAVAALDPAENAAIVCVSMYEDDNLNGVQDSNEVPLAGGTISLEQGGSQVQTFLTDGNPDPFCFDSVDPGMYTVVGLAPPGYGVPNGTRRQLDLESGGTVPVAFGVSTGVQEIPPIVIEEDPEIAEPQPIAQEVSDEDDGSVVLQNIGLLMFGLAGVTLVVGVAITFALRSRY